MDLKKKKDIGTALIISILLLVIGGVYSQVFAADVIYYGSNANDVLKVQEKLKDWGYMQESTVDGSFGRQTEEAIKGFQKKHGLPANGKADQQTLDAMGLGHLLQKTAAKANDQASRGASTRDEVYLLAQAVHGEARGEPYIGQVAIAAVILNRVEHPSFPNTINGVIYQPGAFTAVSDGQIYLTPDDSTIKAANDALAGWDPSGGAIYYYNPVTSTNRWIFSRPTIKQIGKHVFAE